MTVAILTGPSIYLANLLIEEHYTWDVPTGIGLIAAAILGAVITVIANTIIQRVAEKKKAAMKKQSQKKK